MNTPTPKPKAAGMVKLCLEAGMTYQATANWLNGEGHTTPRGKAWNRDYVWKLADKLGIEQRGRLTAPPMEGLS